MVAWPGRPPCRTPGRPPSRSAVGRSHISSLTRPPVARPLAHPAASRRAGLTCGLACAGARPVQRQRHARERDRGIARARSGFARECRAPRPPRPPGPRPPMRVAPRVPPLRRRLEPAGAAGPRGSQRAHPPRGALSPLAPVRLTAMPRPRGARRPSQPSRSRMKAEAGSGTKRQLRRGPAITLR